MKLHPAKENISPNSFLSPEEMVFTFHEMTLAIDAIYQTYCQ